MRESTTASPRSPRPLTGALSGAPPANPTLESIEGFCLALCHDLRAPVATAGAAVRGLARELGAPAGEAFRFLEIAQLSLAKADELLGALPRLLRSTGISPRVRLSLDELLGAVRDDVRCELELAGGTIRAMGTLPCVLGDPLRLRIALRNILHNAIRYRRLDVPLEIRLRAWRRGPVCTLTISDNGIGLGRPARRRSGVEPVENATGGLGLGLAIARQAIEASGGELSVASRPATGTSFAITLRAAEESGARASRSSRG